jgi:PAS domain S-box-containing protein
LTEPQQLLLVLDMPSKTQTSVKNEARQQSDERWRAAFENSAIGIMMADVNGRFFAANRAFRNMLGYSERELYQLTFLDVTYEEDRHSNLKLVRELVEGKRRRFQIEKRYRCKDGALLWVRSNATLVHAADGKGSFWFNVVEDITERKHMEDELRLQIDRLRETETLLQTFFENSPNLIFLKDRQGRYMYVNREFKRALRVTDEQIKGKHDDEIFSAEQATAFQANDRRILEARLPMEFEETALQEDGQHTSIVHKFPLFNDGGEVYAIGGIVTDITERKKEESARQFSDERYRVLVETANDAVLSIDATGAILFANPATTALFGYDSTELIGRPLTVLMPEFLRRLHEIGLKRYLATGQRHICWQGAQLTGLRKNGQEFPVEMSLGEMTQNGRRIFTGFIRDISERKQAEELRAAAVEFLTKPLRDQDLLDAIRIALERHHNRREQERQVANLWQRFESLTPREREVISMVVSGLPNKRISDQLGTSENTVKVHRSRAMEKMQAKSLPDLVRMMEHLKSPP